MRPRILSDEYAMEELYSDIEVLSEDELEEIFGDKDYVFSLFEEIDGDDEITYRT